MINLFNSDCLDIFAAIRDNCISAIVTDPPYGYNFMSKNWDKGIPGVKFWKEMLRICKPGSFLLSFGGTKTYHRLTCNIEDSGWEIRDCLMWLYGSGMPKSYNVGKGMDKKFGKYKERKAIGFSSGPNCKIYNGKQYKEKRKTKFGIVQDQPEYTIPVTDEAKKWDGYGTGLKPAWEPIVVAMKPIDENFVNNALKYNVSGLNIDNCRIKGELPHHNYGRTSGNKSFLGKRNIPSVTPSSGRWPSNLILDKEAAKLLDEQSGFLKAGGNISKFVSSKPSKHTLNKMERLSWTRYEDSGGASRFFYCSKASPKERRPYNDHTTVKPLSLIEYLVKLVIYPEDNLILDPFMGSGTAGIACRKLGMLFIGIEKDEHNFKIAKRRINDPWFYKTKKKRLNSSVKLPKLFDS